MTAKIYQNSAVSSGQLKNREYGPHHVNFLRPDVSGSGIASYGSQTNAVGVSVCISAVFCQALHRMRGAELHYATNMPDLRVPNRWWEPVQYMAQPLCHRISLRR
ncbi:uncharacterized protein CCR75_009043 [Bremia lactucae]|uniref:Uncharacterized protein n=1 Tax=Bremia lactucae TaxID=4779 RepID=A0A976IB65_BRELC|nr:hypothetical protein CCR75_009043 [Bremia lactucae]